MDSKTIEQAKQMAKELLDSDKYGIYHLTNDGECSWYEFSLEIFKSAGIDVKVRPVTTDEFPRPAPRPSYSVLSNEKWKNEK